MSVSWIILQLKISHCCHDCWVGRLWKGKNRRNGVSNFDFQQETIRNSDIRIQNSARRINGCWPAAFILFIFSAGGLLVTNKFIFSADYGNSSFDCTIAVDGLGLSLYEFSDESHEVGIVRAATWSVATISAQQVVLFGFFLNVEILQAYRNLAPSAGSNSYAAGHNCLSKMLVGAYTRDNSTEYLCCKFQRTGLCNLVMFDFLTWLDSFKMIHHCSPILVFDPGGDIEGNMLKRLSVDYDSSSLVAADWTRIRLSLCHHLLKFILITWSSLNYIVGEGYYYYRSF